MPQGWGVDGTPASTLISLSLFRSSDRDLNSIQSTMKFKLRPERPMVLETGSNTLRPDSRFAVANDPAASPSGTVDL